MGDSFGEGDLDERPVAGRSGGIKNQNLECRIQNTELTRIFQSHRGHRDISVCSLKSYNI